MVGWAPRPRFQVSLFRGRGAHATFFNPENLSGGRPSDSCYPSIRLADSAPATTARALRSFVVIQRPCLLDLLTMNQAASALWRPPASSSRLHSRLHARSEPHRADPFAHCSARAQSHSVARSIDPLHHG